MDSRFIYENFDLLIEPGLEGQYRARVLRSPAGESIPIQFTVPFSSVELENFVLRMGRNRGSTRGAGRPEGAPLKEFGGKLYDAIFQNEVRDILARSLSQTRSDGIGLRLRLRLADAPELADLPWEFLYDSRHNRFLAQSRRTPLVRYLDLPDPPHPLQVDGPLRLLVMISSPSDWPSLDIEREWSVLTSALARPIAQQRVVIERIDANMRTLRTQLRRQEFHVFHFIGHGRYRDDWGGVLVMEGRNGQSSEVTGEELGGLLNEYNQTRLAVLNACEGARSDVRDPFAGMAQSLIQQGLPAVVAMQFEITDDAAIVFAQELYGAIADGYPVEAAIAEARGAIRDEGNPTEWGTPVLYSRASDGHLFAVTGRVQLPSDIGNRANAYPTAPTPPHGEGADTEQSEDRGAPPSFEPGHFRRPISMIDEPATTAELEAFDQLLVTGQFEGNLYTYTMRMVCLGWLQIREREVSRWIYKFRTSGPKLHLSLLELHRDLMALYESMDRFCGGAHSYLAMSNVVNADMKMAFDTFLEVWDGLPALLQTYLLYARQHDAAYEQASVINATADGVQPHELRRDLLEKLKLLQTSLELLISTIRDLLDAQ